MRPNNYTIQKTFPYPVPSRLFSKLRLLNSITVTLLTRIVANKQTRKHKKTKFTVKCTSERILEIGWYLSKLKVKIKWHLFGH